MDGWWAEAYRPDLGWSIGDGQEHSTNPAWDGAEAEVLYRLLEQEVVPEFYTRDRDGVPTAWVARMRESMARLTPQFSAERAVREYTEQLYLPAANNYRSRTAKRGLLGRQLIEAKHRLEKQWSALYFGEVKVGTGGGQHVFEVQVFLGDLDTQAVRVELCAEGVRDADPIRQEMKLSPKKSDLPGSSVFRAVVSVDRSPSDFTVRLVPHYDGVAIPLEDARILWQR